MEVQLLQRVRRVVNVLNGDLTPEEVRLIVQGDVQLVVDCLLPGILRMGWACDQHEQEQAGEGDAAVRPACHQVLHTKAR